MPVGTPVHIHNSKIGTCPHGLPQGACPICSGMAGGNSTTKRDIPRNIGEMTYNQCAAIGAMLKAQKAAQQRAQAAQQNYIQSLIQFQKGLESTHQKILDLAYNISKSAPKIISAPVNFILTQVVAKAINLINSIPTVISNISQKFAEISDKLTAIYGEIKAAISKTISEVWTKTKKRIKSLFFIFETDENENEEKKIDEAKKTFHLKTFIHKLAQKLKQKEGKITNEH